MTGIFIGNERGIHDVFKSHKGRVILCSELFSGTQKGRRIPLSLTVFQENRAQVKFTNITTQLGDDNYGNSYLHF